MRLVCSPLVTTASDAAEHAPAIQSVLVLFLVIVCLVSVFLVLLLWLLAAGRRHRARRDERIAASLPLDAWKTAGERADAVIETAGDTPPETAEDR